MENDDPKSEPGSSATISGSELTPNNIQTGLLCWHSLQQKSHVRSIVISLFVKVVLITSAKLNI